RHHVDPDIDAVQERRNRFAPGRCCAEAEIASMDQRRRLVRRKRFLKRPAQSRPFCVGNTMAAAVCAPFPLMEAMSMDEAPKERCDLAAAANQAALLRYGLIFPQHVTGEIKRARDQD